MWEIVAPTRPQVARLTHVQFMARALAHTMNNDLTIAVAEIGLALTRPDLPPPVQARLRRVEAALMLAGQHLAQFQRDTQGGPRAPQAAPWGERQ